MKNEIDQLALLILDEMRGVFRQCSSGGPIPPDHVLARLSCALARIVLKIFPHEACSRLDREDVVQDAFVRILAQWGDHEVAGQEDRFNWLVGEFRGVALNARRTHLHTDKRAVRLECGLAISDQVPDPAPEWNGLEAERVRWAIEQAEFGEITSEVVEKRLFDGNPFSAIAKKLHISVSTAKRKWQKAQARLRRLLKNDVTGFKPLDAAKDSGGG